MYSLSGNELTATKAFVAISLFNILRFPLSVFSRVVGNIIQVRTVLFYGYGYPVSPNDEMGVGVWVGIRGWGYYGFSNQDCGSKILSHSDIVVRNSYKLMMTVACRWF